MHRGHRPLASALALGLAAGIVLAAQAGVRPAQADDEFETVVIGGSGRPAVEVDLGALDDTPAPPRERNRDRTRNRPSQPVRLTPLPDLPAVETPAVDFAPLPVPGASRPMPAALMPQPAPGAPGQARAPIAADGDLLPIVPPSATNPAPTPAPASSPSGAALPPAATARASDPLPPAAAFQMDEPVAPRPMPPAPVPASDDLLPIIPPSNANASAVIGVPRARPALHPASQSIAERARIVPEPRPAPPPAPAPEPSPAPAPAALAALSPPAAPPAAAPTPAAPVAAPAPPPAAAPEPVAAPEPPSVPPAPVTRALPQPEPPPPPPPSPSEASAPPAPAPTPVSEPPAPPTPPPAPVTAPLPEVEVPAPAPRPAEVAALDPAGAVPPAIAPGAPGTAALRIGFQGASDDLAAGARAQLRAIVAALGPADRLQLRAFASPLAEGDNAARRLSLKRALAVRAYLIESGVRSARIDVRALGATPTLGGPPGDRVDIVIVQ
ncbi:OmpA family protein [Zavarzinia sp. CC-PAN008]|uniref:OmpA family protein n=1 Tax=Zavarzinia sp. CC-PAN008 TaxID=3243332 RepID=UPI003F744660